MSTNQDRPAKRVLFSPEDTRIVTLNGGGEAKFFKNVTDTFKNELIVNIEDSIADLNDMPLEAFSMVVELEPEALAKSHRPITIFNEGTCPFIGDMGVNHETRSGLFLIRATNIGLRSLRDRIATLDGKKPLSALSTIKSIEPFYPNVDIESLQMENNFFVRLIHLNDEALDKKTEVMFFEIIQNNNLIAKKISNKLPIYHVHVPDILVTNEFLTLVKDNPIIFSIHKTKVASVMPDSSIINLDSAVIPETPDSDVDYPIVGVVDTSIKADCKYISPWYVGEETAIIDDDKEYAHGTFVAGLITNARSLNFNRNDFPESKSKVFSVGILGAEGGHMEEIYHMMVRAQEDRDDIKVWNLSLGSTEPVSLNSISEFAVLLDEFQEKYGCLCILSAGNINDASYHRSWPPGPSEPLNMQRITAPGDSVLGVTVASVAQEDGIVKIKEPSIFSRSGPVANLVLKPDLSHYGGNHDNGNVPMGINSISSSDCLFRKDCGTSFSTPLVATIAANLWKSMGYDTKRHTIKGLLAHSARLNGDIPNEHKVYYGWGMPQDAQEFMFCKENEITMIFEGDIGSNVEVIGKLPFPMPESLRTEEGKIKGEIFMTISYDSPLDPNRALEYCLVNIEAGLGEVLADGSFSGRVPAENTGFEQDLVSGKYKWSPVKVYHKKFPQGIDVENWKLQVKMLTREGFNPPDDFRLSFTIILTIRALNDEAQVYDEMVRLMNQYNWEVSNAIIPIEPQIEI